MIIPKGIVLIFDVLDSLCNIFGIGASVSTIGFKSSIEAHYFIP